MTPRSALSCAVNGVLGAICHSVCLTGLSHSLTCGTVALSHRGGAKCSGDHVMDGQIRRSETLTRMSTRRSEKWPLCRAGGINPSVQLNINALLSQLNYMYQTSPTHICFNLFSFLSNSTKVNPHRGKKNLTHSESK